MTDKKSILEKIIHNGHSMVPSKLSGDCPVCHTSTNFDYMGMQESRITKPIKVYNCSKCAATFEHDDLINNYKATFDQADFIDPHEFKEAQVRAIEKAKIREMGYFG